MQDTKHITNYRQSLRERILETAMKAFATKGVKAVRMDDIAQQLGISKRTLYELYDNKEVLLFEGVKCYKQRRDAHLQQLTESCANVMDVILRICRLQVEEFKVTHPQFYTDIAKYPAVVDYLSQDKEQRHQDFLAFLRRGVNEGYFRADVDLELVAMLFKAITEYAMTNRLYEHYSIEQLFHNLLFVSLRGFCTPQGISVLDRFGY